MNETDSDGGSVEGWKFLKSGIDRQFKCPGCDCCFDSLICDKTGLVECSSCRKNYSMDEFKKVEKNVRIAVCNVCGAEVSLTEKNSASIGVNYICPTCCNVVAVEFEGVFLNPKEILTLTWNKEAMERAVEMGSRLAFVECVETKDFVTLELMQLMAKRDDSTFCYTDKMNTGLLIDIGEGKFVSYMAWNKDWGDYYVLSQIYTLKEERRKGNASSLIKFWVETKVGTNGERFLVETPNELSESILNNMGYDGRYDEVVSPI